MFIEPEGSIIIVQISPPDITFAPYCTVLHPEMTNVYSLMLFQTLTLLIRRNSEAETVTVSL